MKQAILVSPEHIVFSEVAEPAQLGSNDVLIHIKKIGVCGSDIHAYKGKHPFTQLPVVQGHEYSGQVVRVGSAVMKAKVGDKVTGRPQRVCGSCGPCRSGRYNVCANLQVEGFQAPGVAQDYFVLPEDRLYVIPESIDFDAIALIEPAAVAAHATAMIRDIGSKNIVISGAGPIGNIIAQFAKLRGAKRVIVSDFNPFRLQKMHDLGITETINLAEENFEDGLKRILKDESFQVGIEAVGVEPALHNLVDHIEKAGQVIIVGVYEEFPRLNMGYVGEHELTIQGSMMYKDEDYQEVIRCLTEGKLQLSALITQRFPFENYNEAYQFIEKQASRTIKVLIDVN
ncbi:zinc-dependent alcohol dehydrogenase [Sphingobacterium faecale]|uniref:Alcohol dehydrogenase catalytic domain-containing protein n=1 Tax=Sphingobacterium faecale TaxID=2803775 RepID=A0ABS1R644_9SPHI|nr:alcohol dehydrogenase catalytic domain-containing protein [Sphingobacterium faecale]MBL1410176.1 alcohol dehydrogenase catalytic domain-containing protein [Sphingobacterium faecale]